MMQDELPGADLVSAGLRDLKQGRTSCEALLVCIGAPRLTRLGVELPEPLDVESPELALYALIAADNPQGAHSRYNALVRRLVSYERALELEQQILCRSVDR